MQLTISRLKNDSLSTIQATKKMQAGAAAKDGADFGTGYQDVNGMGYVIDLSKLDPDDKFILVHVQFNP